MLSIVRCWRSKRGTCDEKGERERQKSQHVLKRHPNALSANQRSKFLLLLFLSGSPYLTSQNCGITWRGISLKVAITISIVNHDQKGMYRSQVHFSFFRIFKFGANFKMADSLKRTWLWQMDSGERLCETLCCDITSASEFSISKPFSHSEEFGV